VADRGGRHALGHSLLAGMQCREAVTTNFDTLYERAVRSAGIRDIAVLPWDLPRSGQQWLLKMHGDAGRDPAVVVLSRGDFVGYDAVWRPAGSTLQSLLLSRHLLVVGASLNDDNVVRLVWEVSSFIREQTQQSRCVGTVLTLAPEIEATELWRDTLRYVPISTSAVPITVAARRLEVFLDAVAAYAVDDAEYLLDPRYRYLLSAGEQEIAEACTSLVDRLAATGANDLDSRWHPLLGQLQAQGAG
jgi:hypothetical protein